MNKLELKLCILGNLGVGKTSIVNRYTKGVFSLSYKSTIGVNLVRKDINIEDFGDVGIQIWDLAGQQSFKIFHKKYLQGADGAFIVYDVTDTLSFKKIDEWIEIFKKSGGKSPIHLIGNKIDMRGSISVSENEGKSYAEEKKIGFTTTSAKTGDNIENAFLGLVRTILKKK
ncbi:MAG: GTP-binding protein [Candidatus Lokiarchaeota archaeon]|nr:GTP-binding protein [Candidatus Lokiarchaeota archaeon]